MLYQMKTMLCHYWDPISVPLMVIGATVIHLPVFCQQVRCRISNSVIFPAAESKASSISYPGCCQISVLPAFSSCVVPGAEFYAAP